MLAKKGQKMNLKLPTSRLVAKDMVLTHIPKDLSALGMWVKTMYSRLEILKSNDDFDGPRVRNARRQN